MPSLQPLRNAFERHATALASTPICTVRSGPAELTLAAQLVPRVDFVPGNNQRPSYAWQPPRYAAYDSRDLELPVTRQRSVKVPRSTAERLEQWAWQPDQILTTPVTLEREQYEARRSWMPSLKLEVKMGGHEHTWTVSALDNDDTPVSISSGSGGNVDRATAELDGDAVVVKCLTADGREAVSFRLPLELAVAA